ncbi:MAG: hypothetical protein HXY39_07455 [Chloroflexi bacterium]|nr:hypothetical protein [Chloroflexota bacterium]
MPHTVYILSDLHLGAGREPAGGEWDDLERFRDDEVFCALIDEIAAERSPVELVIAGDFIDFPRVFPSLAATFPTDRLGATEADSVERAALVLGQTPKLASGHPAVFVALRRLMSNGHSITLVVGERDVDLLWPDVWALVFDAIYPPGAPGELRRRAFCHTIGSGAFGRVYVEHGHEHDATCASGDQMKRPFAQDMSGAWRIRRSWGALFADLVLTRGAPLWLDTLHPATRAMAFGLDRSLPLPAWALAQTVRFLFCHGAPRERAAPEPAPLWPAGRRTAAALVEALRDSALRHHLENRMADTVFAAALERELATFSEADWSLMAVGIERQPLLATAEAGHGAGSLEAAQQAAARAILDAEPAIGTVVMGHTHVPHDGSSARIERASGRAGYFFNCGAWARGMDHDLPRPRTYLRCTPDVWGAYHVELHCVT